VFVVRGCDTATVPNVHPPPGVTLPPQPATSAPADLTGVQLAAVDGTTTVPGVPDSGTSHLSGTVNGPQGPVPGAVVRVEHLVNGHANAVDVGTDAAGHWDLPNIAGGRYRVRAFLPPSFAQAEPEVFFLNEGDQRALDLTVDAFTGAPEVAIAVAPDPPNLGQPTSVVVRVTHRAVDGNGVARSAPIAGAQVTFNASGDWSVTGPPTAGTNENGDASFVVECRKAGTNVVSVTVRIAGVAQPLASSQQVPACIDPRSTSTATTAPGNTNPSSTTTTPPTPPCRGGAPPPARRPRGRRRWLGPCRASP
jgi:hypothetical protein